MSFKQDIEDRSAAHIIRWHARPTQQVQNLAEHHFFVARMCMTIVRALRHYEITNPDLELVLETALIHDEVEKRTGDVPGSTKRRYPEFRKMVEKLENELVQEIWDHLPGGLDQYYADLVVAFNRQQTIESQIVKYADKLDAYLFSRTEVAMGNSLMSPVLQEIENELEKLNWSWLRALRKETELA